MKTARMIAGITLLTIALFATAVAQSGSTAASGTAQMAPLPTGLNLFTALEATSNELVAVNGSLNSGAQPLGQWSGSVTATGWALQFVGTINGMNATITQTGTFNRRSDSAAATTWIDSGKIGDQPLSGSGSFNITAGGTAGTFSGDWNQTVNYAGIISLKNPGRITQQINNCCSLAPGQSGGGPAIVSLEESTLFCGGCYIDGPPFQAFSSFSPATGNVSTHSGPLGTGSPTWFSSATSTSPAAR